MPAAHEVRIALTEAEYDSWNQRARVLGLSVPDFIRRAVSDFDSEETARFLELIARADSIEEKSILLASTLSALAARTRNSGGAT